MGDIAFPPAGDTPLGGAGTAPSSLGKSAGASPLGQSPIGATPPHAHPPLPLPPVMPAPNFANMAGAAPLSAGRPLPKKEEQAPGVYTQVIRQSVTPAPQLPEAAKPAAEAKAPKKRSIPLGLILALNAVVLLAVVLILYFVLRTKPPAATSEGGIPSASSLPKGQAPAIEAPKVEAPKVEAPKVEPPKVSLPK